MTEPGDGHAEQSDPSMRSGLRNPSRAIRALGSAIVGLEVIVLLLAILPMRMLDVRPWGLALGIVVAAAVACVVLAAVMDRRWAWAAAGVLQGILVVSGILHWLLAGIGVVFGITWLYGLSVRRQLSRPPVRDAEPPAADGNR